MGGSPGSVLQQYICTAVAVFSTTVVADNSIMCVVRVCVFFTLTDQASTI